MIWSFAAFCDQFLVTSRLVFKLGLDPSRESLLHLLEQVRRAYPRMTRLRRPAQGVVLEEFGPEGDRRRYLRIKPNLMRFATYNPDSADTVADFARVVLTQAPVDLSLSDLDYDLLEIRFGFDLDYRGNHDELIADTLLGDHPLIRNLVGEDHRIIDCQPFLGFTLNEACDKQVQVEVRGRTTTYEVRSNEFEGAPLSVYLTVRRYWGFEGTRDLAAAHDELLAETERLAAERVVPHIVQPLAEAIASRR